MVEISPLFRKNPDPPDIMHKVPCYQKKYCPHCKDLSHIPRGHCQSCAKRIPNYRHMHGNGYESQTITHGHYEQAGSYMGRRVVRLELCWECYREDHKIHFGEYPDFDKPSVSPRQIVQQEMEQRIAELEKLVAANKTIFEAS